MDNINRIGGGGGRGPASPSLPRAKACKECLVPESLVKITPGVLVHKTFGGGSWN